MTCENNRFEENASFLVTGGAGFIGSNLAEAILGMGYNVRVLDNFSTGKHQNIIEFMNNPKFELVEGDIRDIEVCQKACKKIDYILHQAALGSVPRSIDDPQTTNEVNITGTLNMMIAARDNKVKRFVYASSSSVYGDHQALPKVESVEGKLLSPYAITKKVNELYGRVFYDIYGLQTIGLRYFNVFGKRQDPNSAYAAVIPIFVKKLLNNEVPIINGDGMQSRDFTYIENVVQANIKACLAPDDVCGEVYNIAFGGREYLIDIYNSICELLNKKISPFYGKDRKGDIKHSNADISKAKMMLNYSPSINVLEGLKRSIHWYNECFSSQPIEKNA